MINTTVKKNENKHEQMSTWTSELNVFSYPDSDCDSIDESEYEWEAEMDDDTPQATTQATTQATQQATRPVLCTPTAAFLRVNSAIVTIKAC